MRTLILVLVISAAHFLAVAALSVRVVTWNVLSNKWMDGKFDKDVLEKLLGPFQSDNVTEHKHDVYVVTVQENCFMCDTKNTKKLVQPFLDILLRFGRYEMVGISMTRNSDVCQLYACHTHQHGTVALMVFALEGLLTAYKPINVNGCDGYFIHNAEKGIAGLQTFVKATKQFLCFAGLHLDSKKASKRRRCITDFWLKATQQHNWNLCDRVLVAGDFNTRPGPKERSGRRTASWEQLGGSAMFAKLRRTDEMSGTAPYGGISLLQHLRQESGKPLEEAPITFLPTYSILQHFECGGAKPCFKGSRTPGWTDRVLCSGCTSRSLYTSVRVGKSDHDPVLAVVSV